MGFEVYLLTLYIYFVKCNNLFTSTSSQPQVRIELGQSLAQKPLFCLLPAADLRLHFVKGSAVEVIVCT